MSKDLLNKIRGAIENKEVLEPVKPAENMAAEKPATSAEMPKLINKKAVSSKSQSTPKTKVTEQRISDQNTTGFEQLQEILKSEKEGFTFNRRLVYIDDNVGEALDLLRKKAKINSNVLTSYLLKKFLLENKDLIKGLREKKKDNLFFD